MACINADGTLTPVASGVLRAVNAAAEASAEEVSRVAGVPLYRARASLRELVDAGLLAEEGGRYRVSEAGRARVPPAP